MVLRASFETKVLFGFAAAMVVVAALSLVAWKLADDATTAARWVGHTHEVLGNLSTVRAHTLQIELSTQSFRISGEPKHLDERNAMMATREASLGRMRELTAENPQQQQYWTALRAVIDQRIAMSKQVERLRKTQGREAADVFVATAPLKTSRAEVYQLLDRMEETERLLLAQRNARQLRSHEAMLFGGGVVVLLLFGLLTATYSVIRRQLGLAAAGRARLAASEENLATILSSLVEAVIATDIEGLITRMNPVAEHLTGWPIQQALGRPSAEVFKLIDEPDGQTVLLSRNGEGCPVSHSAAPIRDAEGHEHGVVLVFRDVSVQRQAHRMIVEQNELLDQRVRERTAQLRESEDHLRSVINNVPALITYVDAQQRYVYFNQQYLDRFAPLSADIAGRTVSEVLGADRYALAAPMIDQVLQGRAQGYDWQPFPAVWQAISYVPKFDVHQRVLGYYVLGTDISARKRAEQEIHNLNAELALRVRDLERAGRALRTLSAGNRTMLRATDEVQLLASMCAAIVEAGGYGMAAVWYCLPGDAGKALLAMAEHGFPPGIEALNRLVMTWDADRPQGRGAVGTAIRSESTVVVADMRSDPGYGPWRDILHGAVSALVCPLRVDGKVMGALAIYDSDSDTFDADQVRLLSESADDLAFGIATLRARAEQTAIQAAMLHLTRHDSLTGLPNEVQFAELLGAAIANVNDQPVYQTFAVLQTNIERLSEINDALGFIHGDQLLQEFGQRLLTVAPPPALVARLRGDEFAILLPGGDAPAAKALVQQLEAALAAPFAIADIALDVTARTGLVLYPQHGASPHDLFRHMDIALHQAKRRGASHAVFDPTQHQQAPNRLNMAGELRRAIEGDELRLYLQPKVDFTSGRVCGAEALVRWQHGQRGLLAPGEFIALAEHTGLIRPLTEWVIASSLRLNSAWQDSGCALPIAVNLSARNLRDDDLLEKIRQLQKFWGVAPGLLELEITESALMEDASFALGVLHSLRDEGIPLYIDDFGTGYSSLSYLHKLPVDYIKIDQSFVFDMSSNKDSALIVRSTIDLAHDLGRRTVAEGIETQQHWEQLAALGCDFAQGYFIARPMPAADFQAWLATYRPPLPGRIIAA